jgi:o-succinylbenzoate---CoA ligase
VDRTRLKELVLETGCAVQRGGFVFLSDPKWGVEERAQFGALLATIDENVHDMESGWLCVPSGGTSGGLKFARHDERTLLAAVSGFCTHFGISRVNAVDVLPPHHVSGLMARVRCAATQGRHVGWSWKDLESGRYPSLEVEPDGWVLSLVPTQLQRLLGSAAALEWLRSFRVIFIGGGPAWTELTQQAAQARLPVALCYGMTETAAMVTALRPEEFVRGVRDCGTAMPHARVEVVDDTTGALLPVGETGVVRITGGSVFRGYFPDERVDTSFTTEDLARLDGRGHLQIQGRRDAVIITGGKKVFPEEVEAALRASGQFSDVTVIALPDAEWGQRVVACYSSRSEEADMNRVEQAMAELAPHKRPKAFIAIADWPRNAQGKVNREALLRAAAGKV